MTIGEAAKSGVNAVSTTQLPSGDELFYYGFWGFCALMILIVVYASYADYVERNSKSSQ